MSDQKSKIEEYFNAIIEKWPSAVVSRDQIEVFSGGIISPGRMANLDCLGQGPESFRSGRKRVYPVKPLIEWLIGRSEPIAKKIKS